MTDDPAWPLLQHVCHTRYADLPASAVESARCDILDTFGCMLGGSGAPGIDELFAVLARWGGREESRVLLRDTRLPAPQAALLNASMGHALDFDDTLDSGGSIHPGVSVLGSVLAVCDSLGGVSGRDVLLAVALVWTYRAASRWRALSIGAGIAPPRWESSAPPPPRANCSV